MSTIAACCVKESMLMSWLGSLARFLLYRHYLRRSRARHYSPWFT